METQQQESLESQLFESIVERWGSEALPNKITLIKEVRAQHDLDLLGAAKVVNNMIEANQDDLGAMGYRIEGYGMVYKLLPPRTNQL